jgi:hypothetical protein
VVANTTNASAQPAGPIEPKAENAPMIPRL